MSILYRPVLIESAEQAEALPIGTPVLTILTDLGEDPRVVGADYIDDSFDEDLTPGGNWHCVALVPIESTAVTHQAELCKPGRITRYIADIPEEEA